ncbi:hypothetical protein GWI33_008872 [Rhynchophorus ferrugineus]|uniref:Uncharacterized protein n=1 Tax=Rhynchophorus ferrugineus TaxID=354439 RepID=A0A834ICD2_RHYFE|nr:hypothetical protein GWI33_008872 [Rhynchophorus ferrugineus]
MLQDEIDKENRDIVLAQEQLLQSKTVTYQKGSLFLSSNLRQCFEDNPKLYLKYRLNKNHFNIKKRTSSNGEIPILRNISSSELYTDELVDIDSEQKEETSHEFPAEPLTNELRKIIQHLKEHEEVPYIISIEKKPNVIRPNRSESQLVFKQNGYKKPQRKLSKAISYPSLKYCDPQTSRTGIIEVFRVCPIYIAKSSIKVDNIEVSRKEDTLVNEKAAVIINIDIDNELNKNSSTENLNDPDSEISERYCSRCGKPLRSNIGLFKSEEPLSRKIEIKFLNRSNNTQKSITLYLKSNVKNIECYVNNNKYQLAKSKCGNGDEIC